MTYEVEVTKKALKQLNKIQLQDRKKIFAGIQNLKNSETWGDVRKLVNHQYGYRLRIGSYRVLFNATDNKQVEINEISVEEVKRRNENTY